MNRQILILMSIRAIRAFLITMPIIVIYWQSQGLLIRDIFILQIIFSITVVLFEVPSGYFADRFGRVRSIQLGCIFGALGFFCYWYFPSFLGFALAEIILALGAGFLSGSQEALLYESLSTKQQKTSNTKWQGRLMMTGNISEAIAAICAGVLVIRYGMSAVIMIQWIVFLLCIPLALSLIETRKTKIYKTPPLLKIFRGSFYENKRLQALNLYAGGISAGTLTMVWFVQPFWQELDVDILYFGYLWAGLQLFVAFGSFIAHRLEQRLTFRTLFLSLAITQVMLYSLMALLSNVLWVLLVIPGFWLLRGISRPIFTDYVQREAREEERATVLSINQLSARLVFSIFSPFLGWAVDIWSFEVAFYASAVVFGILTLSGVILLYRSYD